MLIEINDNFKKLYNKNVNININVFVLCYKIYMFRGG
jgi:hypothetical protein